MMNILVARAVRAALFSSVVGVSLAQAQQTPVEGDVAEVVVTGTYIRSQSFQPSSPVDVVTREALEIRAPTSISQFLTDLPYNVNSETVPSGRGPTTTGGGGSVNLRNLGDGATLVMLNSHRHAKLPRQANVTDVNFIVPTIMIKNVEVLKDGASALYGSDAVAGVVNFITRDDFKGFEVNAQQNYITHSWKGDTRIGGLWGGDIDDTHVVVGFEYTNRQQTYPEDMPLADGRFNLTGPWQPARYLVPTRNPATFAPAFTSNALGVVTPTTTARLDTGCGTIVQSIQIGANCFYDFWPDTSQIAAEERYQILSRINHDFSDKLRFTGEIGYSDGQLFASQSTSASINVSSPIIVPGYNPGNSYRAVSGTTPLWAVPDPIDPTKPLRIADANTAIYPLGRVVLMSTPTVQNSGPPAFTAGLGVSPTALGIAFNEDVTFNGRIIGSQGGGLTNNTLPAGQYARERPAEARTQVLRAGGGLNGDIGESSWHWDTYANYARIDEGNNAQNNNVLIKELRLALQGWGGPNCNPLAAGARQGQGQCYFFNPFTSAVYGTTTPNRQDVVDWLMPSVWDKFQSDMLTYDAVVTGELFDLPAGALSLAIGGQYRKEGWLVDFDAEKNAGNIETGAVSDDVDRSQTARALFAEVSVPVVKNDGFGSLSINGAVRYENSGGGIDTTDPKLGLIYKTPGGLIAGRASWGTSFLAPSLFQKFTSSSGLVNINDNAPGGTGEGNRRITTLIKGNPDLLPQEADAYSFGVTVRPLENLSFDVGYWHYKYDQLIAIENTQALVTANTADKIVRDSGNNIIFVLPSYVNVSSLETAGADFEVTYRHDLGRFGSLSSSTMATWVNQMDVQTGPNAPVQSVGNNRASLVTGAPPNLKWRALSRLTWNLAGHSATAVLHYNGRYNNDAPNTVPTGVTPDPIDDATLDAFTWVDLSYSYNFQELFGLEKLNVTVGAQNAFNSKPDQLQGSSAAAFVDTRLQLAYLRLIAKF